MSSLLRPGITTTACPWRARLRLGVGRTIEAPGTTQAFRRSEVVTVEFEGGKAEVRRPDLVGALLGKAAAAVKIRSQTTAERSKHLHDVDALARLLGASDRERAERKMLQRCTADPAISPFALAQFRLPLDSDSV